MSWSVFAFDVVLGAVMIIAALTDGSDAAGSGLAEVYMVGCVIAGFNGVCRRVAG